MIAVATYQGIISNCKMSNVGPLAMTMQEVGRFGGKRCVLPYRARVLLCSTIQELVVTCLRVCDMSWIAVAAAMRATTSSTLHSSSKATLTSTTSTRMCATTMYGAAICCGG